MISILSLVTSIKDYLEVVHKFIEYDSVNINYTELGSILTFFILSIKNSLVDFFHFSWLLKENIWSLPIIIPDISSAMISEISVLDGYFHNAFNFLDTPVSYNEQNGFIACLEKFIIGGINSFFLFLPTSTAHIITLRRFVMQGLQAGYIAGLGTIAGNVFWLGSVILGFRFFIIPWLSLDIFRYVLGFILLVKYMWDSYNEKKQISNPALDNTTGSFSRGSIGNGKDTSETESTKRKIFLLNFLLALTEQTSIYPFISNISISPETSILENFSTFLPSIAGTVQSEGLGESGILFITIHLAYLIGITVGSLSLLHLSCWFWENPAFKLYMWVISSFKVSTSFYYKVLNFVFLYLTMLSAVCSIPYYGLDYTITNPIGYVNDDRLIQDKVVLETSFLGTKASDRNTRRNRGRHGRRERWKRRIRKYRTFDASLYDQGIYDLFTVEDLNYGFDRFWLRRKLRNHRVRFRFFPGPWMRSFKKQLAKPRLESYTGPRIEFFRILYEQVYHPSFHAYNTGSWLQNKASVNNPSVRTVRRDPKGEQEKITNETLASSLTSTSKNIPTSMFFKNNKKLVSLVSQKENAQKLYPSPLQIQKSTLRKFLRKFDTRIKTSQVASLAVPFPAFGYANSTTLGERVGKEGGQETLKGSSKFNLNTLISKKQPNFIKTLDPLDEKQEQNFNKEQNLQKTHLSNKNSLILQYRTLLTQSSLNTNSFASLSLPPFGAPSSPALLRRAGDDSLREGKGSTGKEKQRGTSSNASSNASKNRVATQETIPVGQSLMLLHPLKFYLQQENAFKQKLRYYTPSIYRKFSVENNAPYFRVMMKRYFYNFKPTLRWERTMKAASLRKARRKTTRIPRKLQKSDLLQVASGRESSLRFAQSEGTGGLVKQEKNSKFLEGNLPLEKASIQKSTYNYSVVSKRASRYRYQIYKDVLQHWYYSPFNRLLLKLDVDNFIKRQPNAHFLTTKEENLLHLRRFLLFEHYNTLRWYTNMEHYRAMKTQLNGGTKSFSSRAYNQQFFGTFKKIRHLFAITPSVSTISNLSLNINNNIKTQTGTSSFGFFSFPSVPVGKGEEGKGTGSNVLKFDQLLYNEYPNNKDNPLLNPLIIHEELFSCFEGKANQGRLSCPERATQEPDYLNTPSVPKGDVLSQSQEIVREYLIQTRSSREEYIKKLLSENNYSKLTQFIYKGQKVRGNEPVTNQKLLNNQEADYLLTSMEKNQIEKQLQALTRNRSENLTPSSFGQVASIDNYYNQTFENKNLKNNITEQLYLTYLKNWKHRINDQESLKNYLTRRLEKRQKRKQKKEKQLLTKLKRLETWFSVPFPSGLREGKDYTKLQPGEGQGEITGSSITSLNSKSDFTVNNLLTTGLQKSILDGMYVLNNVDQKVVPLNEKNEWKVLLLSKIKQKTNSNLKNSLQDITLRFNDLENAKKLQISNDIKIRVQTIQNFVKKRTPPNGNSLLFGTTRKTGGVVKEQGVRGNSEGEVKRNKVSTSNLRLYNSIKTKLTIYRNLSLRNMLTAKDKFFAFTKLLDYLKPIKRKSLQNWRNKERVLGKQKRSRKEFKLLNKKMEFISNYLDGNELELGLQNPLRQKRDQDLLNNQQSANQTPSSEQIYITNSFKRKRSPQRRSRTRRNRGVFKKRSLTDLLRKDFVKFLNEKNKGMRSIEDKGEAASEQGRSISEARRNRRGNYYQYFNENLYGTAINNKLNTFPVPSFPQSREQGVRTEPLGEAGKGKEEQEAPLKQRKSKQRKERYWKQKRSKYSQKRRKFRKRRRYTIVKIRNLNKQFKRIKNQVKIQNWWWKNFIPSIQASNEALWQIERDKLIQQKLSQLSTSDILTRDNLNNFDFNVLQIGNKDFKPLALPEATRLIESKNSILSNSSPLPILPVLRSAKESAVRMDPKGGQASPLHCSPLEAEGEATCVNKLYESLFINKNNSTGITSFTEFLLPNTNLPFYAGWDESLRKLIVTNRMLSRKDTGFTNHDLTVKQDPVRMVVGKGETASNNFEDSQNIPQIDNLTEFNLAPLQGMNAATTLYWQIPFTTYDPDQFFALGMDGFSPIGWRKFLFRHSILKTWLDQHLNTQSSSKTSLQKGEFSVSAPFISGGRAVRTNFEEEKGKQEQKQHSTLIIKTKKNIINEISQLGVESIKTDSTNSEEASLFKKQKQAFATSRRLKKRYRRVKKHPRTPVWFPSGPLSNQVLPVHYIYVFYKRSRLPRDRYLKRRLLNVNNINKNQNYISNFINYSLAKQGSPSFPSHSEGNGGKGNDTRTFNYDFTLRKRLKPKRKYHLKRDYYASNVIIPRRFKFMSSNGDSLKDSASGTTSARTTLAFSSGGKESGVDLKIWRPLSSLKIHKSIADVVKEQQLLRRSALQKQRSSKQPNIRVKQLRRRVQRQILRTVWRYRPRAGGFVWPGDYLKLEQVKAPKLQTTYPNDNENNKVKVSAQEGSRYVSRPKESEGAKEALASRSSRKEREGKRKKKRNLVEWQIQPKKYLYEKHNLNVLIRKAKKAKTL